MLLHQSMHQPQGVLLLLLQLVLVVQLLVPLQAEAFVDVALMLAVGIHSSQATCNQKSSQAMSFKHSLEGFKICACVDYIQLPDDDRRG